LAFAQATTGIADPRVFDLHDFGTEPGERLGAGWSGFELGEIDDPNAGKKVECRDLV
jgi:hypothetical protein